MTEWQPIETAPRDRPILVWTSQGAAIPSLYRGELWLVSFTMNDLDRPCMWMKASHWMPLPEGPAMEETDGETV